MGEGHGFETCCGSCGTRLRVKTRAAEKQATCPKCKSVVTVKAPTGALLPQEPPSRPLGSATADGGSSRRVRVKSVVVVAEESGSKSSQYIWLRLGLGLVWLVLKALYGWRLGKGFDRAFFEQVNPRVYCYLRSSVQDHALKPRLAGWHVSLGLALLYGMGAALLCIVYRLVDIYLIHNGPDDPLAAVPLSNGVTAQLMLEGGLFGSLLFVITAGIFIFWTYQTNLLADVEAAHEPLSAGQFVKIIPVAEWDNFKQTNVAQ